MSKFTYPIKMNYFNILSKLPITLSCLLISLNCASTQQVKPRPIEGQWEKCPLCNGTGVAEVSDGKPPAVHRKDRDIELEEAITSTAEAGCCLFNLLGSKREVKLPSNTRENKIDQSSNASNVGNNDERQYEENITTSTVKRKIKCYRCRGKGWLKITNDSNKADLPDNHINEAYKKLNEEINIK